LEHIPSQAEIIFDDVSFQYDGNNKKALQHIHLRIAPGEKLAIVGVNGAGKSTLVKLLAGIYSPTEGSILVGGTPINSYREDTYRNAVNMVLQHYALFAFTIGENVLMRRVVSEEDRRIVEEALRMVGLWDKVSALPNGINTEVTREFSSGVILSGGEQQKLALARAYAQKSQILILDEPSSSLDAFAETDILGQLYQARRDKTIILVTHKLMDVKWADRIIVINNGQIVEKGDHQQLLHLNGEYAAMIRMGMLYSDD
jgi:ABC-type multidrug transport system fused ATPase/permease subunit